MTITSEDLNLPNGHKIDPTVPKYGLDKLIVKEDDDKTHPHIIMISWGCFSRKYRFDTKAKAGEALIALKRHTNPDCEYNEPKRYNE